MDGVLVIVNWLNIMLVIISVVKNMMVLMFTLLLVVAFMIIVMIGVAVRLLLFMVRGCMMFSNVRLLRIMNYGLMVCGGFVVYWLMMRSLMMGHSWVDILVVYWLMMRCLMMGHSWVDILVVWSFMRMITTVVVGGAGFV